MLSPEERFRDLPPPGRFPASAVVRELGDGLLLRHATEADTEALAAFNRVGQSDPPDHAPNEYIANWVRELMGGAHPRMRARDFTIVEDTKEGRIASTVALIPHRFCYGGIAFDAGQPEVVATHPAYRRRGLVRAQFDVIHRWSEGRDQRLLLVEGIPWYYRQFGYELALEHGAGRVAQPASLPRELPSEAAHLEVRAAEPRDVAFLAELYGGLRERHLLFCERDEADWGFDLEHRHPRSYARREIRILEGSDGRPVGAFAHYPVLVLGGSLFVDFCEVVPGTPWPAVAPRVLWELRRSGEAFAARDSEALRSVTFALGTEHPVYAVAGGFMAEERRGYAYYVRVACLPGFLRLVAPALERRLAESSFAGHTGSVEISLYRSGIRISFEAGRVKAVEEWLPSTDEPGDVGLPGLTFLQLVFGYRSLDELERSFADCLRRSDTGAALLETLFPRRTSKLWLTV